MNDVFIDIKPRGQKTVCKLQGRCTREVIPVPHVRGKGQEEKEGG